MEFSLCNTLWFLELSYPVHIFQLRSSSWFMNYDSFQLLSLGFGFPYCPVHYVIFYLFRIENSFCIMPIGGLTLFLVLALLLTFYDSRFFFFLFLPQKAILLQQSSWQNNVRMSNLVEQVNCFTSYFCSLVCAIT